ncbi:MAG: hypothetical protein CSB55_06725 [Candidatus Cloacimonadota bacterium]|nr:MAG: hypothetical protein CSB55_06725 [Candidatus Cloacimonadota bacterium]
MKKISFLLIIFSLSDFLSGYELRRLADVPTAGILQRGESSVFTKLYRNNGMLIGSEVGLFPRFMFGISYGGESIVGNEKPVFHDKVEFSFKFRAIDESPSVPAVVIGYNSQGHGSYIESEKRYDIKSKGFYLVTSRNWILWGNIGLHGGLNYSLEDKEDNDLNFFFGVDKTVGNMLTLICEYDLALNDNDDRVSEDDRFSGAGKGYLNAGAEIRFTDYLSLRLNAYDLLENSPNTIGFDRSMMIIFNMTF